MSSKTVAIDCFTENVPAYIKDYSIVAVDVIRSTTVEITAVASGRRCFFAPSVESALLLAAKLDNPLLIGEIGGYMPQGFDINNSPAEIERCDDKRRPAIVVSSSGTSLLHSLEWHNSLHVACLRNYGATINHLTGRYDHVAVVGAPTRGEFREEDQLCCAWIAAGLIRAGYKALNKKTEEVVNRWRNQTAGACTHGKSAEYLRRSGQTKDLDFIISHVDDLNSIFVVKQSEIVRL